jgi:exopolysaccharide production protein ExoZ
VGNAGYGAFGVDLFFVISGFIMAQVAQGRSAGEFMRDRLWRIYPLWWIAVLPWLVMFPRSAPFVASSVTLWPIYPGHYYVPVLGVGWTLTFELLFYMGIAVALASRRVIPLALYLVLLLGSVTIDSPLLRFLGSPMGLEFLMGLAIALLPRRTVFAWFIPVAVSLIALSSPGTGDVDATLRGYGALQRVIEWGIPAALIVWGALSIEHLFGRGIFRIPVWLGDASYSIYLFHPLIAFGFNTPWPIRVAIAIVFGCIMHCLVERRIMATKGWTLNARMRLASRSLSQPANGSVPDKIATAASQIRSSRTV